MKAPLRKLVALLSGERGSVRVSSPQEVPAGVKGKYVVVEDDVFIGEGSSVWNLVCIGSGSRIGANVTVGSLVSIGAGCVVGDNSMIEGGVKLGARTRIGRDCFLGPGVVTSSPVSSDTGDPAAYNGVTIGDGAVIGAGAHIQAGVAIGARAVVGMGSVVSADVEPETVVVGSPARSLYTRAEYDRKQREFALKFGPDAL